MSHKTELDHTIDTQRNNKMKKASVVQLKHDKW